MSAAHLVIGIACFVGEAIASYSWGQARAAANPNTVIPWIGRRQGEPTHASRVIVLFAFGISGGIFTFEHHTNWGFAAMLLVLLIPAEVVRLRHNAQVRRSRRADGGAAPYA